MHRGKVGFGVDKKYLIDSSILFNRGSLIELAKRQWLNSQECLYKLIIHVLDFRFKIPNRDLLTF